MTRDVLSAAQHQLLDARRNASAARHAEERALAAVLQTRDEARMQVMQACHEAKQQIVTAQARATLKRGTSAVLAPQHHDPGSWIPVSTTCPQTKNEDQMSKLRIQLTKQRQSLENELQATQARAASTCANLTHHCSRLRGLE